MKRLVVLLLMVVAQVACTKPGEKFIGTWHNAGDIALTISQNGDALLVQQSFRSLGTIYQSSVGRARGNVLELEQAQLPGNLIYVEADDTLVSTSMLSMTFRRISR